MLESGPLCKATLALENLCGKEEEHSASQNSCNTGTGEVTKSSGEEMPFFIKTGSGNLIMLQFIVCQAI